MESDTSHVDLGLTAFDHHSCHAHHHSLASAVMFTVQFSWRCTWPFSEMCYMEAQCSKINSQLTPSPCSGRVRSVDDEGSLEAYGFLLGHELVSHSQDASIR